MALVVNGDGNITGLSVGGLPSGVINSTNIVQGTIVQGDLDTSIIPLGVGQTWTDVKASRAAGTTYTNSTGKPIYVFLTYRGNPYSQHDFYINGTQVSTDQNGGSGYSNQSQSFFIVPNGATYLVNNTVGSNTYWWELR